MMDLSESGPLETSQIAVLAAAAAAFLYAALKTPRAGAPAFAAFSLVLGVAALREYSAGSAAVWQTFLESHAARWLVAALLTGPLVFVTLRDRAFGPWAHLRAVMPMLPVLLFGVALVWLAAAVEEWGGTVTLTSLQQYRLLLVEELLELLAYSLTLAVALRALHRARGLAPVPYALVTVLPRRRRAGRRFGRA